MIKDIEVICTIGPSSYNRKVLTEFKNKGVDFFRINLSHTSQEEIEERVIGLNKYGVPIMLDTEGRQIRTGNERKIEFMEGERIKLYNKRVKCDKNSLFLAPLEYVEMFKEGDVLYPDFNSVKIKIINDFDLRKGYTEGEIIIGGKIGRQKGVHIETTSKLDLPALSNKDLYAIELAKKHNIRYFTLSFINDTEDIRRFLELYPEADFIPKIETKESIKNLNDILKTADKFLIDRGDLSRYISLEKIPFAIEYITRKANLQNKKILIATNTLDSMYDSLRPNISEVEDILSCLDKGIKGIVLTKESAVGKHPITTIKTLSQIIERHYDNQDSFLSHYERFLIDKE